MNAITGLPISDPSPISSPTLVSHSSRVLVVDDEAAAREPVMGFLREFDFQPVGVEDGLKALELARRENFDVAVVDLSMPGISGLETIRRLKAVSPHTQVIILTGSPSLETSLAAIDEQVFAYLCKPPAPGVLAKAVQRAAEHVALTRNNRELLRQLEIERNKLKGEVEANRLAIERRLVGSPEFIGKSAAVENIRRMIAMVAPSDLTVLVQGESGTGKEVIARLIGELSGRNAVGGFIKINCPAIPENLLESELFGHEAGAFTGAQKRKPGRLELAPNGTVFLDEIGDMPLHLQAKLLQVIESKQFFRVGGTKTITVNTRIIAATNAPLEQMVQDGAFRGDLFYRLCEYRICLPPLRERTEDIPLLLEHFIHRYGAPNVELGAKRREEGCESASGHPAADSSEIARKLARISSSTLQRLITYPWPGNVREFESLIRRFVLTGDEQVLIHHIEQAQVGQAALPASSAGQPSSPAYNGEQASLPVSPAIIMGGTPHFGSSPVQPATQNPQPELGGQQDSNANPQSLSLRDQETQAILNALNRCAWNRRNAAKMLGTSYATLRRKIDAYNLKPRS